MGQLTGQQWWKWWGERRGYVHFIVDGIVFPIERERKKLEKQGA
jgi:hypothetical protein